MSDVVDAVERRPLGKSGLQIAPLMLGGNTFGWTVDESTGFRILDHFVDQGFNAIDTADVYSSWIPGNKGGESETVIGNWIAQGGRRDKIVLATKFGMKMGEDEEGLSRDYMIRAVEASLKRLKTDHIDLYQSHRADDSVPIDETLRAYEELIRSGKVRAIGASNYSAAQLGEALDVSEAQGLPRYDTLQPWYNLIDRGAFEGDLEKLCRERGVSVIPYFGLASGFLTGKYRKAEDFAGKPREYRVKGYLTPRGLAVLDALDAVSADVGATPGQVALAWLMTKITAPIASATSIAQLDELIGSARLRLDAEHIRRLDETSDPKGEMPNMTPPGRS